MTAENKNTMASSSYNRLLKDGGFQCFLWTQFLGAFNDNVYKMIVSVAAVDMAAEKGKWLALAGAVFVVPFLLFAGWSGQLADRFSKTKVLIFTKAFEMLVMTVGIAALISGRMEYLLLVLFMLAIQANFFSPANYSKPHGALGHHTPGTVYDFRKGIPVDWADCSAGLYLRDAQAG